MDTADRQMRSGCLIILGILVFGVVPLMGYAVWLNYQNAKYNSVKLTMSTICQMTSMRCQKGAPSSATVCMEGAIREVNRTDPWGAPYQVIDHGGLHLVSPGTDGVLVTGDDINLPASCCLEGYTYGKPAPCDQARWGWRAGPWPYAGWPPKPPSAPP